MIKNIVFISFGASFGAVLRWIISTHLNKLFVIFHFQLGTLISNLLGSYLIGLAILFFNDFHNQNIPIHWKLMIITGFLGSLTTFSTFSAEVIELIQKSMFNSAFLIVAMHLFGSLFCTFIGLNTVNIFTYIKNF